MASFNGDPSIPANEDDILTVIGMGRTQEDGNASSTLQSTELYQIDTTECQELYPEFLVNEKVVICASGDGRDRYARSFIRIQGFEYRLISFHF